MKKRRKLKRQLSFLDLYAICTGTMISSGFFLLPGIAAGKAGPAEVLAFFLAGILTIPTILAQGELAAAMPRAGGTYFFLDRSLGPIAGTMGGFGTWLALLLKGGFGLVGFSAYFAMLLRDLGYAFPMRFLEVIMAGILIFINILGVKKGGRLQWILVFLVLGLLSVFIFVGIIHADKARFKPFNPHGWSGIFETMGMVFIAYAGLTKIASLAEEARNPDKNIPYAMMASLGTVLVVYTLGVAVMVGVLPRDALIHTLTPAADAASVILGPLGHYLVSLAALFAFISCANAGLMAASRYPLAMARDRILPHWLRRIGPTHTPYPAILLTGIIMILFVLAFDVVHFAELASTFQLLLFASVNLALIIMRESKIVDYIPGFRSCGYPWIPLIGIGGCLSLIFVMGSLELIFVGVVLLGSFVWFLFYVSPRVERVGAWIRIVDRFKGRRDTQLALIRELRAIQKERGLKLGDPFEEMVLNAPFFDLQDDETFEDFFTYVGAYAEKELGYAQEEIKQEFMLRNRIGETPVENGIAIPHMRLEKLKDFHLILGRSKRGLAFPETEEPIHVIFTLLGTQEHAALHIRILAELAVRADREGFVQNWIDAKDEEEIKLLLLTPTQELES